MTKKFKPHNLVNWLSSMGDRHTEDVELDEIGYYVLMWNGRTHQNDKIYLPEEYQLKNADKTSNS